jgi:hypothetical protein
MWGAPQRSPISPLSFSLFIDDKTKVQEFSKYHIYATICKLIIAGRGKCFLNEFVRLTVISRVFEWSLANSLKLNPSKSMVLPIYRNYLLGSLPALFLVDDFIPYVFKAKTLGVTFSYDWFVR